jgi:hypothetical protein
MGSPDHLDSIFGKPVKIPWYGVLSGGDNKVGSWIYFGSDELNIRLTMTLQITGLIELPSVYPLYIG